MAFKKREFEGDDGEKLNVYGRPKSDSVGVQTGHITTTVTGVHKDEDLDNCLRLSIDGKMFGDIYLKDGEEREEMYEAIVLAL